MASYLRALGLAVTAAGALTTASAVAQAEGVRMKSEQRTLNPGLPMADLRDRLNLSLLFVTHDLRAAAQLCDRIIVMQKGEIVEHGLTAEVFADPQHSYTQNLLSSIPGRDWTPPSVRTDAA